MYLTLYTEDYIAAAHSLENYPGKCAAVHGHTWKICVWVKGQEKDMQPNGILWDFSNIKTVVRKLDHVNLNNVLKSNPSAENIALFIYAALKGDHPQLLFRIRLYEEVAPCHSYCETGDF
ncbi:MAG TPA: 6-carboxytetrahydropterin synthase QueD [Desulfobacteraceae bacterium]|jgi:6-pyruvoyltetrahydropterin/6-carboxytetrahydropterin synthase|nr:6-carboxytetrahydropterin synthase QueD [Desulfobacteraceae bacterium]